MSVTNRVEQGLAASVGTAAITILTALRVAAAREEEVDAKGVAIITILFSTAVGVLWSFMPRAADPLSEATDAMKEEIAPTLKTAVQMATMDESPATTTTIQYGSRSVNTTTTSSRYDMGANKVKVRSINDDDLDPEGWEKSDYPWDV